MFPITLFPSPFPRKEFNLANDVQTIVNELMHKVAFDHSFLNSSLESTVKVDSFTKNLLDINNQVEKIGSAQSVSFGLFRTDYMIDDIVSKSDLKSEGVSRDGSERDERDSERCRLKQVESNAIASGFSGLAPRVSSMHRYLTRKYQRDRVSSLPSNSATHNVALSFIQAFDTYRSPSAVILFVIEDWVVNVCDQRMIEESISELRPDVRVLRRPFSHLHPHGSSPLSLSQDRRLFIHGNEIALVYFRHCYDPAHYDLPGSWSLRLQIELSRAIKCPSINYHLSGVKKLQQILSKIENLEKFLPPKNCEILLQTFTGLHGLDFGSQSGDDAVKMALKRPENFVLKPQREGGGNNWYGKDIVKVLEPIKESEEREAYILMDLIKPPIIENYLIVANAQTQNPMEIISELGIYGSVLGSKNQLIFNRKDGHLLRSKKLGVNEGGISAGFGALDSPLLVD